MTAPCLAPCHLAHLVTLLLSFWVKVRASWPVSSLASLLTRLLIPFVTHYTSRAYNHKPVRCLAQPLYRLAVEIMMLKTGAIFLDLWSGLLNNSFSQCHRLGHFAFYFWHSFAFPLTWNPLRWKWWWWGRSLILSRLSSQILQTIKIRLPTF